MQQRISDKELVKKKKIKLGLQESLRTVKNANGSKYTIPTHKIKSQKSSIKVRNACKDYSKRSEF